MIRRAVIVILLMAIFFGAGYLFERGRWADAQAKFTAVSAQLSAEQATVRLYQLQDQLLTLVQQAGNKNYGDAATLSTKFFDDLRAEAARSNQPNVKSTLESVLNQRDAITTALAKGDPKAYDLLHQLLATFRQILGKTGPALPAAT